MENLRGKILFVSHLSAEGAGTLVKVSVVPSTPPHFFSFLSFPPLYVGRGKGLG